MKIGIGADHGGTFLKEEIKEYLRGKGYETKDVGTWGSDPVDYPDIAEEVAALVTSGAVDKGIVICGTGIGISISANKIPGIRCALLSDVFSAKATRSHNDANMMALGGRVMGPGLAVEIVDAFLHTPFSNEERHQNRINKISAIEKKYSK